MNKIRNKIGGKLIVGEKEGILIWIKIEVLMFFFLFLFRWWLKIDFVSGWICNKFVDSNFSLRRWSDR